MSWRNICEINVSEKPLHKSCIRIHAAINGRKTLIHFDKFVDVGLDKRLFVWCLIFVIEVAKVAECADDTWSQILWFPKYDHVCELLPENRAGS